METLRRNQCHYCREALGRTVFIVAGHSFCSAEHSAFYRNEHRGADPEQERVSPVAKWLMYFIVAVFVLLILGLASSAKAAVHCADDVLCKGEQVVFDERSYICNSPYAAMDIAKTHNEEGAMKAKSHWDVHFDNFECIAYDKMDGVVGELILDGKEARVISFEVGWPKKKVWMITKMKWSAGVLI